MSQETTGSNRKKRARKTTRLGREQEARDVHRPLGDKSNGASGEMGPMRKTQEIRPLKLHALRCTRENLRPNKNNATKSQTLLYF